MRKKLQRFISAMLSVVMTIGATPIFSAYAEESTVLYPYTLFSSSTKDDAISIVSDGLCINGTLATSGNISTTAPFTNGNYSTVENSELSMINAHYAVIDSYFQDALLFSNDVEFSDMNNNISGSLGTDFSVSVTGNTSLNGNIGAIYDVNVYKGEDNSNFNASNSVIYSRMGDVSIDCSSFSFSGLIYAPKGTVTINADNVNFNGIILAESILIVGSNVNINYDQRFANVIGNAMGNSSESIENDITFELEKNIIIDTTYLSFFDDGYVVIDGFEELNGKLLMSSMFEQMSVDIYDDHGINVFSQEIPPSFNWNTSSIGLLYGDNYVEIKATEPDGTVMQKNFLLRCYTPDFNDNLMIDRDDDDGDGLINYIENYFGTDINNPDSDVDGLTDFQEIYDSSTDPLLWDTDENGISDGEEDNDGDGLDNITEYIIGSYIYAVDSDMDGLTDYDEYNLFHTSPLSADTDGDTLTDKEELDFGTSPLLYDTNDNGISDADEKYTTELDITEMGVYYDPNVYPTLSFNSDVKNTLSVTMETYDNDVLINGGMTGYIGCAYTFTSERQFDSAVMNFTINPDFFEDEDFIPAIYYFNEEQQLLEKLPNQTISGNTVSATVEHFSTYIVLNSKKVDEVWNMEIDVTPSSEIEVVFVLDYSTSLDDNDPKGYRIDVAKDFVDKLGIEDKVGVVVFNHGTDSVGLTNDFSSVKSKIEKARKTSGSTEIWNGLKTGLELFDGSKPADVSRYVIFMSDGWTNTRSTYDTTLLDCQNLCEEKSIDRVFSIALGRNYNESVMQSIASADEYCYKLDIFSDTDIKDFFEDTYDDIYTDVESGNGQFTDTNNDGISDEDTILMCKGYLKTGTLQYVFDPPWGDWESLYEKIQENDDFDGDGLKNGEEISISRMSTGQPFVICKSSPAEKNSDEDIYDDYNEVNKIGSNPLISEAVYYDFDTDALVDNYFMSEEYYKKLSADSYFETGNYSDLIIDGMLIPSIVIGNYGYGGNADFYKACRETLIDYFIYTNSMSSSTTKHNELFKLISDLNNHYEIMVYDIWNSIEFTVNNKNYLFMHDEYLDYFSKNILPRYNDLKSEFAFLKTLRSFQITDDDFYKYYCYYSELDEAIKDFEVNYGAKLAPGLKLLKSTTSFFGHLGNGLAILNCAFDGYQTFETYSEFASNEKILQQDMELLKIISEDSSVYAHPYDSKFHLESPLAIVANDMYLAVNDSVISFYHAIEVMATTSSDLISWGWLATLLTETELKFGMHASIGVGVGITLGKLIGKLVTPVTERSVSAVRVLVMAKVADILKNHAAGATKLIIENHYDDAHIHFHKSLGYQIGIWELDSNGLQMNNIYLNAINSRIFAEENLIDLLKIDISLEKPWTFLRFKFYIHEIQTHNSMSTGETTYNTSEIIQQCNITTSFLEALLSKYPIY